MAQETKECFKCKAAGFPNTQISFEKIGENPQTGKGIWRLIDPETGGEHRHKGDQKVSNNELNAKLDRILEILTKQGGQGTL